MVHVNTYTTYYSLCQLYIHVYQDHHISIHLSWAETPLSFTSLILCCHGCLYIKVLAYRWQQSSNRRIAWKRIEKSNRIERWTLKHIYRVSSYPTAIMVVSQTGVVCISPHLTRYISVDTGLNRGLLVYEREYDVITPSIVWSDYFSGKIGI